MRNFSLLLGALAVTLVAGCATPTVVEESRPSDKRLTCEQLENEMSEADNFRRKAEQEKGVTGTNVAAAIFFWPAILGTYANAGDAIRAADNRKRNLMDIYNEKGCK